MKHEELIVVGGGIVGCFTAYFAAEKGFRVALIEAGHLGSGSSGKCAGIHTTQLVLPIDIQLSKRSQEIYREVASESVLNTGFLSIEPYWMSRYSKELLDSADVRYRVLSGEELADWIDWMNVRDYEVGVYTPDDIVVETSGLFKTLREKLKELGVRVYEWTRIAGLDAKQRIVNIERDRLSYDYAVLAGGAWNRDLLARSGVWWVPTLVYACQILSFNVAGNVFDVPVFIEEQHVYMRRFGPHSLLVGNGFALKLKSPSDCPPHPVKEFIDELGQKLLDRLKRPEIYRLAGGWTGVCSSTPDGRPLLGQVPGNPDLFIIDGLDGYGIMRGPALSQDLVEYMSTGRASASVEAFTPARFTNFAGEPDEVIELHSWL